MSGSEVDIGFLEEKDSYLLHPRFFPSKIGGKPSWLDLKNVPNSSDIVCKRCEFPLIFLCQVYAPYEEEEDCFHRTIFIFICKNGACCKSNNADNFLVYRCQLPRANEFYSFHPYEEKKEEFHVDKWSRLCTICGIKAPSHCSRCKKIYYCGRKHQVLDWQNGHKELCDSIKKSNKLESSDFIVTPAGKKLLFNEWELIVDNEDREEASIVDTSKEMEKLQKMMQERKDGTLSNVSEDELQQYARPVPEDKVFSKFNKRIARHPDQVLRYDRGGTPLWITSHADKDVDVPNCEYCGNERQFEFQIMPQLLNFINVGVDVNSIDWGVLAIYTCKTSCSEGPANKKEHIIKQDLS